MKEKDLVFPEITSLLKRGYRHSALALDNPGRTSYYGWYDDKLIIEPDMIEILGMGLRILRNNSQEPEHMKANLDIESHKGFLLETENYTLRGLLPANIELIMRGYNSQNIPEEFLKRRYKMKD